MNKEIKYVLFDPFVKGDKCNFRAKYVGDPRYINYVFEFRNVEFQEDQNSETLGVWFECSPIYDGPAISETQQTVDNLKEAGEKLLMSIVKTQLDIIDN